MICVIKRIITFSKISINSCISLLLSYQFLDKILFSQFSFQHIQVATERLNGYLVTCINYIRTGGANTLDLAGADELHGVKDGCPMDFCAPPTVVTVRTTTGYLSIEHPLDPGTRTVLNLRFRTRFVL